MNAMQNMNNNKPMTLRVPTQQELDGWVDEALDLFRNEHASGREFTAWEVCQHIIAVHGNGVAIPHASRGNFVGVRELVRSRMNVLQNDTSKPYYSEDKIAADGQNAIFWIPMPVQPQLAASNQVTITIAKPDVDDGSNNAGNSSLQTSTISYKIGGFTFND